MTNFSTPLQLGDLPPGCPLSAIDGDVKRCERCYRIIKRKDGACECDEE